MRPLIRLATLACTLALALVAASALRAQDPEPTDADKAFFRDLKRAVLAGDRAWIAEHICFPVRAVIDGRSRMIANAADFDAAYAQIMTLDMVNAIRRANAESLVRTTRGIMVGDGEIWLGEDPAPAAGTAPKVCIIAFGNVD